MAALREVRLAPQTKQYLKEQELQDPLLKKVLEGLAWRLAREPGKVGYPIPGYNPTKYVVTKSYRLPVPRILRLVYSFTRKEVLIELAEVMKPSDVD